MAVIIITASQQKQTLPSLWILYEFFLCEEGAFLSTIALNQWKLLILFTMK